MGAAVEKLLIVRVLSRLARYLTNVTRYMT